MDPGVELFLRGCALGSHILCACGRFTVPASPSPPPEALPKSPSLYNHTGHAMQFLFALKPHAYQRCRNIFIVMNLLALIGYAAYPLMPPRLVNDCEVRDLSVHA